MGATTGAASAFASTETRETAPKCAHRIGAVAMAQAAESTTIPASLRGTGYLEAALEAGTEDEDRRHCGEGELEARIEQARTGSRPAGRRADQREVPTVAWSRREPRQRREPARDPALTTDGCQPTAATYATHRGKRRQLRKPAWHPGQPAASRIPATTYATF